MRVYEWLQEVCCSVVQSQPFFAWFVRSAVSGALLQVRLGLLSVSNNGKLDMLSY